MISTYPDVITFNKTECCVMANLQSDVTEIKEKFANTIPTKCIDLFLDIFKNTDKLVFIPTTTHEEFYIQIVSHEAKYLESNNVKMLSCDHQPEVHLQALQSIAMKFVSQCKH